MHSILSLRGEYCPVHFYAKPFNIVGMNERKGFIKTSRSIVAVQSSWSLSHVFCDKDNPAGFIFLLVVEQSRSKGDIGALDGFGSDKCGFVNSPLPISHDDKPSRYKDKEKGEYYEWISPFGRFCITAILLVSFIGILIFGGIHIDNNGHMTKGSYVAIGIAFFLGEVGVLSIAYDWWNRLLNYLF